MAPYWTEDEKETLRQFWPVASASIIGAKLDKSRNSVIGQARRMDLVRKKVGFTKGIKMPRTRKETYLKRVQPRPMRPEIQIMADDGPVRFIYSKAHHCRAILEKRSEEGDIMICGKRIAYGQTFSFCSDHLDLYTNKTWR